MKHTHIACLLKSFCILTVFIGGLFFLWYIPLILHETVLMNPEITFLEIPSLFIIEFIACLCYFALWNFWKICVQIGCNNSFCEQNALAMKNIGFAALGILCTILLTALFIAKMIRHLNGAMICLTFFGSFVVCGMMVLCFSLAQLIHNAAVIKEENDLTI